MAVNRYEILVRAILNKADLQNQLNDFSATINNKLKSKPITLKTGLALDEKSMENQIQRYQNRIDKMKFTSPAFFNSEEIKPHLENLKIMLAEFEHTKGVRVTKDDIATEWDNMALSGKKYNDGLKVNMKDTDTFIRNMGTNIKKVAMWAIATTALYGTLKKIREGTQFIKDLDKAMTNTQIVTGLANEQIKSLAIDYNRLAQEVGATTLEVADGSLEWFRQGKTAQEALELTRSSLIMSKLGNVEAAQSTEYLTSTLNGFKLEAEDAMMVIDKLVALDNAYATSVAEIAEGLQKSSNSAQQAGVSFDELASYITIISSVTRQAGASIGTSLRTMFARMEAVKLGKMFEDEATNINDVEKALSLVDIKLRDTADSFRPMGDVFTEIASKWSTMNDLEQSAVATAIAGIRQRENFLVLMNNYNDVLVAQAVELNSAGLALERYQIYLGSIEAIANKNTAAMQKMWQATINTDFMKWTAGATTFVANLIAELGGLVPVLTAISVILSTMKWSAMTTAMPKIAEGIKAIGLAFKSATMLTGIIAAIMVAIGIVVYVSGRLDRAIQKNVDTMNELNAAVTASETTIAGLSGIVKRIDEISEEFENLRNKTSLTNDEQQRFYALQNEIKALMPTVSGQYDEQGNFILTASTNLAELNKQKLIEIQIAKDQLVLDKERQATAAAERYGLAIQKETQISKPKTAMGAYAVSADDIQDQLREQQNIKTETIQMLTSLYMAAQIEGEKAANAFMQMIIDSGEAGQALLVDIMLYANQLSTSVDTIVKETAQSSENLLAHLGGLYEQASAVKDLIDSYDALNGITVEQTQKLAELFPLEYQQTLMVDKNTGLTYLNIQALKQMVIEKAKLAYQAAQTALALAQENNALQSTISSLERMVGVSKGYLTQVQSTSFWLPKATSGVSGLSEAQKNYNDLLKDTISMLKQQKNDQKDALKEQLDGYKKIIDAKKKILDQMQEEKDYQDELGDKNKELTNIDNELLQIQFDNSDEAKKRRLELEDEKAKKITEIDKFQADRSVEIQKDALDEEYDEYKEYIEKKIDALDDYLKRDGAIRSQAIDLLESRNQTFYNNLMAWNRQYGSGIDNDITAKWNNATQAAINYNNVAAQAPHNYTIDTPKTLMQIFREGEAASMESYYDYMNRKQSDYNVFYDGTSLRYQHKITGAYISLDKYNSLPKYHEGGIVGNSSMKENEILATLLKGEVVATESQAYDFIRNTLPNIINAARLSGDTNIPVQITIEGNVDEKVMPLLKENITKAVYKAMTDRGFNRGANSFSI